MLLKTLKSPRKKLAQEHASKSTSFPGTLSSSLSSLLEKIHVANNEVACKSSCKSELGNCLRKELPKTVKDLNFEKVICPEVNQFSPKDTRIAKNILNRKSVTEIVNLLRQ